MAALLRVDALERENAELRAELAALHRAGRAPRERVWLIGAIVATGTVVVFVLIAVAAIVTRSSAPPPPTVYAQPAASYTPTATIPSNSVCGCAPADVACNENCRAVPSKLPSPTTGPCDCAKGDVDCAIRCSVKKH
jgi:hypothetical protein